MLLLNCGACQVPDHSFYKRLYPGGQGECFSAGFSDESRKSYSSLSRTDPLDHGEEVRPGKTCYFVISTLKVAEAMSLPSAPAMTAVHSPPSAARKVLKALIR